MLQTLARVSYPLKLFGDKRPCARQNYDIILFPPNIYTQRRNRSMTNKNTKDIQIQVVHGVPQALLYGARQAVSKALT